LLTLPPARRYEIGKMFSSEEMVGANVVATQVVQNSNKTPQPLAHLPMTRAAPSLLTEPSEGQCFVIPFTTLIADVIGARCMYFLGSIRVKGISMEGASRHAARRVRSASGRRIRLFGGTAQRYDKSRHRRCSTCWQCFRSKCRVCSRRASCALLEPGDWIVMLVLGAIAAPDSLCSGT
jgi:hypothetical protein